MLGQAQAMLGFRMDNGGNMTISAVISAGLQGVQVGINRTNVASGRVAGFNLATDSATAANSMVDLLQGSNAVKISANVIKTGDEILGTLIDIKA